MEWIDQWAYNENVGINYLKSRNHDERLVPLLYIPGALDAAEQALGIRNGFNRVNMWMSVFTAAEKARLRKAAIHWMIMHRI